MFKFTEKELHQHLKKRMHERGATIEEIETTLNHGKNEEKQNQELRAKYMFLLSMNIGKDNILKKKK
jgi:hypothetical protein